jgi:signal transduction histidine kinase
MNTSNEQQETLAQCQQQAIELSAEIVRLQQENDRLIHDSATHPESVGLEEDLQDRQSRDRLLDAASAATNILLTLDNLDEAIDTALRIIGEGSGCDRINVLENFFESPATIPTFHTVIYEWTRPGIVSQMSHLESGCICTAGIELFLERYFVNGDGFGGLLAEWDEPLRSAFAAVGVESSYSVPIRVKEQWWGVLCLDYCHSPVRINPAEIAVLRTIAACIGSAIQRDRAQKATLQAEHARSQELQVVNAELQQTLDRLETRDRLLEATAATANVLLTIPQDGGCANYDFDAVVDNALQILGESLETDRIKILENTFDDPMSRYPGSSNVLYEWTRDGTIPQISHIAGEIVVRGLEDFMESFLLTNGFGGLVDEWIEPFRSSFKLLDVKSTACVPIRIEGQFWGILAFDDCREAKYRSQAEIAVLKTVANCIGSAIQRDRTTKAILQAEQDRAAELTKANEVLKKSLDYLATETSLEKFLGQILGAIAEQFDSPLAEYWYHPDDTAYIGMMSWHGQTYNRAEILQQYPNHLGVDGFPVPPEMMSNDNLQPHKQYFITEDWLTDPYFKHVKWLPADNLYKQINVPLVLGHKCIGALVVRMPRGHQIATEQIELAQALAHQVILVVQFTRLAEEAKQAAIYEERNRLAGEIHDTLAQTFTGISVQLELVKYLNPQHSNEVRSILDRISSLAQTGLGEARRSVWSIYSANEDFADLAQQLADCVENLTAGTDLHTQIDLMGTPTPLSSFLGVNLLRIGQESIVNTLKHAQASTLTIELEYSPHQVSLCTRDNGRGFASQVQTEGFGLISISERADRIGGQLRITTQPGQGTEIFVQVPL